MKVTPRQVDYLPVSMATEARTDKKPDMLYREARIDPAGIREADQEVELAFSSEQPVQRYDWEDGTPYNEVLSHDPACVDMSRLNNAHPLLLNHNSRDPDCHIGVIKSARIDADKKGRAVVRISRSQHGKEIFQDIKDGIRTLVSVGYRVGREIRRDKTNGVETRSFEWMPYEVSLVPIPADNTVGVGRQEPENPQPTETPVLQKAPQVMPETAPAPAAPAAPAVIVNPAESLREQRKLQSEILAIGKRFNKADRAQEIAFGDTALTEKTVSEFRKEIMDGIKSGTTEQPEAPATQQFRTPGEALVNSDAYKAIVEKGVKGRSIRADIEIPVGFSRDTAVTTGLTSIDKQPGIVTLGVQPPRVADLMTQSPTSNTTIRYIQEAAFANAAAATAENGAYPEAVFSLSEVDATIKKIAVIGRVTDEFFLDYDATRDYVNNRLAYMVAIKEDSELLNADATGSRIRGLLNFNGIQTQAQGADTVLDAIFKAITKIRSVGFFEPDAIVMNPSDLQGLRLTKDQNGQYYFGGPFTGSYGQPGGAAGSFQLMIWGLPVIWTTSISAGTMLVGAFRLAAQIFRKLGLTIETTNSDASDFQYGRIAIRATTRLTLACYRPLGFCTVTGANGAFA